MKTLTEKIGAKSEERVIKIPQGNIYKTEATTEKFGRDYLTSNKLYK
jgi:hypothetical protein